MIKVFNIKTNKIFLLLLMFISLILSNLSFALWPIFLVEFKDIWMLTNTDVGWISGSYFIGYLLLTPVYVGLTDKYDAKWIVIIASISVCLACFSLWFFAVGFWSTCLIWGVVGSGLAGTYMPGLQVLNDRLNMTDRVKLTPWYTSSFGLSNGISFAVIGYLFANFSWKIACYTTSISAALSAIIILFLITSHNQKKNITERKFFDLRPAFKNKEALGYIFSYGTHTYELFAYRAWIFTFLLWASLRTPNTISSELISLIIGIFMFIGMVSSLMGAKFCLDYGRKKVLMIIGFATFVFSVICAISISLPLWVIIILVGIYHAFIMLDSGALTAGTVSVSDDNERGAILAFHSIIGFAGGAIAGPIIGFILDINGGTNNTSAWIFAFISMGLGSLFVFLIQYRSLVRRIKN